AIGWREIEPAGVNDIAPVIAHRVGGTRGDPAARHGLAYRAMRALKVLLAERSIERAELSRHQIRRVDVATRRVALDERDRLADEIGDALARRVLAHDDRRVERRSPVALGERE